MKVPQCLSHYKPLEWSDLFEIEQVAFAEDDIAHRLIQRLMNEVHRLQHELVDPQYQFAGSRIHRAAVLCREASIDKLRAALEEARSRSIVSQTVDGQ